jgi:hypothetical protein
VHRLRAPCTLCTACVHPMHRAVHRLRGGRLRTAAHLHGRLGELAGEDLAAGRGLLAQRGRLACARKVLGQPRRCKVAHAFLWKYS